MTERLARIGRQSLKSIGLVNVRDGSRDFGTGDGGGGGRGRTNNFGKSGHERECVLQKTLIKDYFFSTIQ